MENIKVKNSKVEISVIIPFHGDKEYLKQCLNGISKQRSNLNYEIIVVESGNSDIKEIRDLYQNVILISSDSLLYPGKARNIGAAKSKSEFIAFIDSDCIPAADWISNIFLSLRNGNDIVVGPILNLYPFHPIASVDNLLVFPDYQKYRRSKKFKHFPSCNLGIKKILFEKSGGFPEDLRLGEDTVFSSSLLQDKNVLITYNNKVVVRHSGRKNIKEFIEHQRSFGYNRDYLISRNQKKFSSYFLYSFLIGLRRLLYISARTVQWNLPGLLRILFYSPVIIIGLSAWTKGFWRKSKKTRVIG